MVLEGDLYGELGVGLLVEGGNVKASQWRAAAARWSSGKKTSTTR
jgi:hypothetical protein